MGTPCYTHIYDGDKKIACLRRKFDGFPNAHGLEVAEFLASKPSYDGMGCLAVQLITHLKNLQNMRAKERGKETEAGLLYLEPVETEIKEIYGYVIKETDGEIVMEFYKVDKQLFVGDPESYLTWINSIKEEWIR